MSTGYYYYNYVLLSKIAKVLGKDDDARRFAKRAEGIRAAFNAQFFDAATGQYAGGSQGSNTLALSSILYRQNTGHGLSRTWSGTLRPTIGILPPATSVRSISLRCWRRREGPMWPTSS